MDTTPKYILMCEKAEEIQKEWEPKIGDVTTKGILTELHFLGKPWKLIWTKQECTWLPRQDQLQKMLLGSVPVIKDYYDLLELFAAYAKKAMIHQRLQSYEQLWLAFVRRNKNETK